MSSNKTEENYQLKEIDQKQKEQLPQIGTQILDASLPSDLNFDRPKNFVFQGDQIKDSVYSKNKSSMQRVEEDLKIYTIKGKRKQGEHEPKFKQGQVVHAHLTTYEVKSLDDEGSGWKVIWQKIVGYAIREILLEGGYLYILEKTKEGYLVHSIYNLTNLLKIFSDTEQQKIRLVFQKDGDKNLINKNFKVKNCEDIIEKLCDEISGVGLAIITG